MRVSGSRVAAWIIRSSPREALDRSTPLSLLGGWLRTRYDIEVQHFRELDLHKADDEPVFDAAREAGVVVMTKDRDFVNLVERRGPPPQVLWITCGNTSNAALKRISEAVLEEALELLAKGEPLVEISDASQPPKAR